MNNSIIDKMQKKNYDKYKLIKNLLNIDEHYKIDFFTEKNDRLLKLSNKNKIILTGHYNFFGIYKPSVGLWIWASSIPGVYKKIITTINKLKSFNYLFELGDDDKTNFYYQFLTQDILMIKNETQLQWINELLLYLTDNMFYFNPINSESNIQFLTLIDIKEKFF